MRIHLRPRGLNRRRIVTRCLSSPSADWPAWLRHRPSSPRWPWRPLPAATLAATTCTPTGFVRDGINLTAAQIGGTVTGALDATGCDIGVYNPTSVTNATSHGADYFGVVVNGVANVNVTNSKVHDIGDDPFNGIAAWPCHPLYQRRERHDQRQPGLRLPEERDRGQRPDRRWQRSLQRQDLRDGPEERRHRRGSHRLHRPERHRDQERRERHREEQHRQRLLLHAGRTPRPRACCSIRMRPAPSRRRDNKFADNEVNIYGVTAQQRAATSSPSSQRPSKTGVSTRRPRSSCRLATVSSALRSRPDRESVTVTVTVKRRSELASFVLRKRSETGGC